VRFVELSPRAEQARTDLPLAIRRLVSGEIRRIAERPDWGVARPDGGIRVLAPGHSPNSGLIASVVQYGRRTFAIVYRLHSADDLLWIEDIREVFLG
jgi:hypothetical protein